MRLTDKLKSFLKITPPLTEEMNQKGLTWNKQNVIDLSTGSISKHDTKQWVKIIDSDEALSQYILSIVQPLKIKGETIVSPEHVFLIAKAIASRNRHLDIDDPLLDGKLGKSFLGSARIRLHHLGFKTDLTPISHLQKE